MWLAGETEVLGENLPRRHFVNHKSHLPDAGANPGRRVGKPATNRFSYGAALTSVLVCTLKMEVAASFEIPSYSGLFYLLSEFSNDADSSDDCIASNGKISVNGYFKTADRSGRGLAEELSQVKGKSISVIGREGP
jgi:hypothetical protein